MDGSLNARILVLVSMALMLMSFYWSVDNKLNDEINDVKHENQSTHELQQKIDMLEQEHSKIIELYHEILDVFNSKTKFNGNINTNTSNTNNNSSKQTEPNSWKAKTNSSSPTSSHPTEFICPMINIFKFLRTKGCCKTPVNTSTIYKLPTKKIHTTDIIETLKNRRIIFIGDSLTRGTFINFLRFIHSYKMISNSISYEIINYELLSYYNNSQYRILPKNIIPEMAWGHGQQTCTYYNQSKSYECRFVTLYKVMIPWLNSTISLCMSYRIFTDNPWDSFKYRIKNYNLLNKTYYYSVSHKLFEDLIREYDNAIVNVGRHYKPVETETFGKVINYIGKVLSNDMTLHKNKKHIFRLTFPIHHYNDDNISCDFISVNNRYWTNNVSREILSNKYDIETIDYYNVLNNQNAYHATSIQKQDCGHWCYDKNLWMQLWSLILSAIKST